MAVTGIEWVGGRKRGIQGMMDYLRGVVTNEAASLAEDIHAAAVSFSPARTGQYRASWSISIGTPSYKNVTSGGELGAPLPPPLSVAPAHGRFTMRSFYVSNGRPYAGYIENGTPRMAAQKVLARAVQSVVG